MIAALISEAVRDDDFLALAAALRAAVLPTDDLNNSACRFWRFLAPAAEGASAMLAWGPWC
jgi:hypothetical protein